MRKSFVATLFFVVLALCLVFLKRPDSSITPTGATKPSKSTTASASEPSEQPSKSKRPRWTKPARNDVTPGEVASASKAIVYGPADFARGELQNIVVNEGIALGNDSSFVPRFNPKYRRFGNFISTEETSDQPFDSLNLNLQASSLGDNEVTFEVRTRSATGSWSEWREISAEQMKEPIPVEAPQSTGWQFRVVLFANEIASSPKVETVSIEPLASSRKNFSSNNTQ